MSEEVLAQQIAYRLARPGFDLAFVKQDSRIFYAYCEIGARRPTSAVVILLQQLFDEYKDHSFFILRNRIFTTAKLTAMCLGMVKIVAKRARGEILTKDHSLSTDFEFIPFSEGASKHLSRVHQKPLAEIAALRSENVLEWARRLAELNPRGEVLHDYDRDIACLLVDKSGELLAFGLNSNSVNKTLHAEVNMIQDFYRRTGHKIPLGARLITTRKPCRMCAGMIHDWSEDPASLEILFAEEDKSSRGTVLDAMAQWIRLDTV